MQVQTLTVVARGYVLAGLIGVCLAVGGADQVSVLLAIWLGGAALTICLALIPQQDVRYITLRTGGHVHKPERPHG